VADWAESVIGRDDEFSEWHYRSGLHAAMAGQLMVRMVELDEEAERDLRGAAPRRASVALRDSGLSFLQLPWDEALTFFVERQIVSVDEFDAIQDRFKTGAFTSRVLVSTAARDKAFRAITAALEEGTPDAEVVRQLRDGEFGLGFESAAPHQLETIVRNNISTSYAKGRLDAMSDPDVIQLRPYWQYWSAGDVRVRDSHRALNGKIFAAGSEVALYYTPPLGHNCRCSTTTLSRRQFEARGLVLVDDFIPGVDPDEGWEAPPAPLTLDDLAELME